MAYLMEVQGPDGAQMCSTALVIQPPAVAGADAVAPAAAATSADSKKGGAKGKPASQDSKAAGAAAAKPRPDAAAPPAAVPVWRYETKQQLLGTVRLAAAELLECCGQQQASEGSVQFLPPAPLFSAATGTLLSLKEASHKLKPIGSCSYKLVLHPG
ncbi:hypothetical protein OEZ85_008984 [Tetradesmus obliquus]|uniref:Uncharacterized protein n=1 Tax=Tetradesmus obliquus TaxID=3088 RepID=A0ABY8TKF8_TETOB|nr:hypothetical protein OEZ85_008984 [Tetradesmus obliquus]